MHLNENLSFKLWRKLQILQIKTNVLLQQQKQQIHVLHVIKETVSRDFRPSVFFIKLYPWVSWFMG
jgi:hypothetical protein